MKEILFNIINIYLTLMILCVIYDTIIKITIDRYNYCNRTIKTYLVKIGIFEYQFERNGNYHAYSFAIYNI